MTSPQAQSSHRATELLFSPSKSKDAEKMEKDGNANVMNLNAGAEESRIVDSEMFVRSDGVPMAFMMPPQGMERQQVREIMLILHK